MGCFNCDDPGHRVSACPHRVDMVKAAQKKLEYFVQKRIAQPAASVLFVLCTALDERGSLGPNPQNVRERTVQQLKRCTFLTPSCLLPFRLVQTVALTRTTRKIRIFRRGIESSPIPRLQTTWSTTQH